MTRRASVGLFVVAGLLSTSRAARAQDAAHGGRVDVAEARAHFERGLTLLHAQNFEGALAEFQRSYAINPRASVLYNIAVTQQSLNRYPDAIRSLEQYLRDAQDIAPARRTEAEGALEQLRALIAHVRIVVDPPGATVRVDGQTAGIAPLADSVAVGPGRHIVEALRDGRLVGRDEFTIASGETHDVRLLVAPTPPEAPALPPSGTRPTGPDPTRTATLTLRSQPPGAELRVDGEIAPAGRPMPLASGEHALLARGSGRATWRGSIGLSPGESRNVTLHLAPTTGLGPGPFLVGIATTAVLAIGAGVTGVLTLTTKSAFDATDAASPDLDRLAAQGTALRDASDVLWIATGVAAVTSVVLLTRTRFGHERSGIDLAIVPTNVGGFATARITF